MHQVPLDRASSEPELGQLAGVQRCGRRQRRDSQPIPAIL